MLDGIDLLERHLAGALGQQSDLPLPVRGEVARSVRRPGDGFGMSEQVGAHDGKLVR
jgi:hypothetical protein